MKRVIALEKGEDTDDVPEDQPPIKHDVHYAIKTWFNHRSHHTYPRAGGYDDQDADLMDDWHTLSLYYVRVEKGVTTGVQMPDDAPHINTLTDG